MWSCFPPTSARSSRRIFRGRASSRSGRRATRIARLICFLLSSSSASAWCSSQTTPMAEQGSCSAGRSTRPHGSGRCASRSRSRSWCRSASRFRVRRSECRRRPRGVRRADPGYGPLRLSGNTRRRVHVAPVDRRAGQCHRRRRLADADVPCGAAMKAPSLTLGIEEEYQIIDPATRELKSYITEILSGDHLVLTQVKPELHQSIVEVGTKVCNTPAEARQELVRLRRDILELVGRNGLRIAAAGTHPFSSWIDQEITPLERYLGVRQDMGELAQRLLIFGTHVHVGIEDREFLIDALNVARYFLPHLMCLSTSSPFWLGRKT